MLAMVPVRFALFVALASVGEAGPGRTNIPSPKFVKERWSPPELAGTPCINGQSREAHRIRDLPGLPSDYHNEQFAGEVCVDAEHGGRVFYWMVMHEGGFEADVPLMFWLNGGPGCSSLDGLFMEGGPFRITPDLNLEIDPHAWTNLAHVVFVDQPVGTGLSWVDDPVGVVGSEAALNREFFTFLVEFYDMHPGLRSAPLYFGGESYAGHYIPSIITHMALPEQQALLPLHVNGALIGNGWTEPKVQFGSYADFALGAGIIGKEQADGMRQTYARCIETYHDTGGATQEDYGDYASCESLLDYVIDVSGAPDGAKVNMYDIRRYSSDSGTDSWPKHLARTGLYLKRAAVLEAIHATGVPHDWTECSDPAGDALAREDAIGVRGYLPDMLARGTRLLFYNGQFDIVCNHLGTQEYLRTMEWPHQAEWQAADRIYWILDGEPVGYGKTFANLSFTTINGASHMVPMDKPVVASEMVRRFFAGLAFNDPGAGGPSMRVSAQQPFGSVMSGWVGDAVAASLAALVAGAVGLVAGLGLGRARAQREDCYSQLA